MCVAYLQMLSLIIVGLPIVLVGSVLLRQATNLSWWVGNAGCCQLGLALRKSTRGPVYALPAAGWMISRLATCCLGGKQVGERAFTAEACMLGRLCVRTC